jgi:RNA polymerase sigma-70 factor (ECF subfamily)
MTLVVAEFGTASPALRGPAARDLCALKRKRAGSGLYLSNEQLCQLVTAIADGRDREAFAELFRYFAPRLRGFGLRRGVDAGAAEELAQETMLTVWRKAESFDPGRATVSTWIFTILRNKSIDLFRRETYPEADLSEASDTAADDRSPDESLSLSEASRAVSSVMKSLPEEQLAIVRKAFFEGKSHRAIADEMKLPLGTVKSRMRLALARMRVALPEGHV